MITVLVNAYAVSPSWGSEPGMGWNWVVNLARYCSLHVITEGEWREDIEHALASLPQRDNLHFHYLPVEDKIRRMCWNQGDWRFYYYYRQWQRRALAKAREIIRDNHIDVVHQLNMIGFREPGDMWQLEGVPVVWGPVGGVANIPSAFLKGAGWKTRAFLSVKNVISDLQLRYQRRVRRMVARSHIVAATPEVANAMKRVYDRDVEVVNETGTYAEVSAQLKEREAEAPLKLLWVGKFDYRKRLDLALRIVAECRHKDISLRICGEGSEEQTAGYKQLAKDLGVADRVEWMGRVPHERILEEMASADLFLFTSVSEATSTVVLEAVTASLPVVSFNCCGFGPIVKDIAGRAVEMTDEPTAIRDFAAIIDDFAENPEQLPEYSRRERENLYMLSWDWKARHFVENIYFGLVNSRG